MPCTVRAAQGGSKYPIAAARHRAACTKSNGWPEGPDGQAHHRDVERGRRIEHGIEGEHRVGVEQVSQRPQSHQAATHRSTRGRPERIQPSRFPRLLTG
jgi:hypothetical protein